MPNTSDLSRKRCVPCEGGMEPLPPAEVALLLKEVPAWKATADGRRIRREWRAKDFVTAIDFFRRVAEVAEAEDHHPDLHLAEYRNVAIEIWTHAANGLTENDFILAAKIDRLPIELKR
jgi:4a-hydroxytetrahydrobiopterin dehydratase